MDIQTGEAPAEQSNPLAAYDLRIRRGASWFYWVAALSLVTQITYATGSRFGFSISLGATDVLGVIANRSDSQAIKVFTMIVGAFILLLVATCGYFASRGSMAAFLVGLTLLLLDSVLLMMALPEGLINLVFRAFAVYSILGGLTALKQRRKLAAV